MSHCLHPNIEESLKSLRCPTWPIHPNRSLVWWYVQWLYTRLLFVTCASHMYLATFIFEMCNMIAYTMEFRILVANTPHDGGITIQWGKVSFPCWFNGAPQQTNLQGPLVRASSPFTKSCTLAHGMYTTETGA